MKISNLCDIDPDLNYVNNVSKSEYYDETIFNQSFGKRSKFSLIHLNIRNVPLHFTELLDTIDFEFKIIALSDTGINSRHINYNILNDNMDIDLREKRVVMSVYIFRINLNINYEMTYNLVRM